MNETDRRLDRLRGYFHTGETPIATPHCLDAGTIAALADGTLAADARPAVLQHLAGCAFCRRAVASVADAVSGEGPVTHEIAVVEGRGGRWWRSRTFRIGAPLAAAAVVLVVLSTRMNQGTAPHRATGQGGAPMLIAPRGTVVSAQRLQWSNVPGANRYRVTLFSAQGRVLYETEVGDTVLAVPDSVQFVSGQPYLWKVEARTGWDRWLTSDLVDFTIARAPPP